MSESQDDLTLVSPEDTRLFLTVRGWSPSDEQLGWTDAAQLWQRDTEEVLLPTRRANRDYSALLWELCRDVAKVELADAARLVADLRNVRFDTVRLRVVDVYPDNSIDFGAGASIVEQLRLMLTAAASSVVDPKRNYPGKKPALAQAYMHNVRLAPTEVGSFVFAVRSPIEPLTTLPPKGDDSRAGGPTPTTAPTAPSSGDPIDVVAHEDAPTGRDVVSTLVSAVEGVSAAVAEFRTTRSFEAFERDGVSANLVEAIRTIGSSVSALVRLNVVPSPAVEAAEETVERLSAERVLPRDNGEMLSEVVDYLRTPKQPSLEVVSGPVMGLRRRPDEVRGLVTISADVDRKTRIVRVRMAAPEYQIAINAHRQALRLYCVGTLRQTTRGLHIDSPTLVTVDPADVEKLGR